MAVTTITNRIVAIPLGGAFTATVTPTGTVAAGTVFSWDFSDPNPIGTVTWKFAANMQSCTFTAIAPTKVEPVTVTVTATMTDGSVMIIIGQIFVTTGTLLALTFGVA